MQNVPFVTDDQAQRARDMETSLLSIRDDAGILFVGVDVDPVTSTFSAWIGCDRKFESRTIELLAITILKQFLARDERLEIKAHRGIKKS